MGCPCNRLCRAPSGAQCYRVIFPLYEFMTPADFLIDPRLMFRQRNSLTRFPRIIASASLTRAQEDLQHTHLTYQRHAG